MGPKPFSVGSGDVNFDKVFSVPQAPGIERTANAIHQNNEIITPTPNTSTESSSDSSNDEQKDSDEKEGEKFYHPLNCAVFESRSHAKSFYKITARLIGILSIVNLTNRAKHFKEFNSVMKLKGFASEICWNTHKKAIIITHLVNGIHKFINIDIDSITYRNGNNGHTMHKSDSLEEDLQRAISTAERRKVCNNNTSKPNINSINKLFLCTESQHFLEYSISMHLQI